MFSSYIMQSKPPFFFFFFLFPWTFSKLCLHLSWSTYNQVQCSTHRAELWRIIAFPRYLTHLEIHSKFLRPQKPALCIQFVISCYPRCFLQYYCLASYSPFHIGNSAPFINTAWFCWISNHFLNLPGSFWHLPLPSKGCQRAHTHIFIHWISLMFDEKHRRAQQPGQTTLRLQIPHTQSKAWHNYSRHSFPMRCSGASSFHLSFA